jgi:predicted RND superfamily exporter protein
MAVTADSVAEILIRFRWVLLALAAMLALASFAPGKKVEFDRSIENMFADTDPLLSPYRKLARTFGGNEVILAVYHDDNLLAEDGSGIRRLRKISRELADTPGVAEVMSLADLSDALSEMQALQKFFRPASSAPEAIADPKNAIAMRFRELFTGYTHGPDQKTVAVICMLSPSTDQSDQGAQKEDPRRETVDALREKIDRLAGGLLAGEPVMVVDGFRYLEFDGQRLSWVSTILLSLTIAVLFRSLRWVLVPFAVVQLALLLTTMLLGILQLRLSMVSSMLSAIVTVVGVATVIHFIIDYRDTRSTGASPQDAFKSSFRTLWAPILWAIVTDVIGFISLIVAEVGPIQDFAIMTSIGTFFVLVSALLLIPGLALIGQFDRNPPRAWGEGQLTSGLAKSVELVRRFPRLLSCLMLILAAFAVAGTLRLQVETDFTKNFRKGSLIVAAYNEVEDNLGGAGAWEVLVPAPERLDWQFLDRVDELQHRLRKLKSPSGAPALTALSFVDAVKAATPQIADMPFPVMRDAAVNLAGGAMRAKLPKFTAALHAADPQNGGRYYYRIMLRAPERQSAEQKKTLIESVTALAKEEFPESEVTGFFVLLTYLIDSILRDQWFAFAISVAGVGVLMTIIFRSPKLAIIALVPNVLPILMVTGLLGWIGLRINLGAAMIAAVSMGLSIDSSIHYLTAFRRARQEGRSVIDALDSVQQKVGRAMVFSTLALVVGFTALSVSQFMPTIYFGVLAGLTMLGSMTGNLVILPLLLLMTTRNFPAPKEAPA